MKIQLLVVVVLVLLLLLLLLKIKEFFSMCIFLGVKSFTPFHASVGEGMVFFGKIELFVFVRSNHLKSGMIEPLVDSVKCVKTGMSYGVDRAPNKGKYIYILGGKVVVVVVVVVVMISYSISSSSSSNNNDIV